MKTERAEDLTGRRFGRLTIQERDYSRKGTFWIADCDCGGSTVAAASDFKRGGVNSCGCLRREMSKAKVFKHGESHPRTREYSIWCAMQQRCNDRNHKDYPKYGGRGITISHEFNDYSKFLSIMGRCPEGFSIERRDNNGPYSPDNCRWADAQDQSNNKRNNKLLTIFGETKTLAAWGRDSRCAVSPGQLKSRIGRQGWQPEQALITPIQPKNWMKGKRQNHFKIDEDGDIV